MRQLLTALILFVGIGSQAQNGFHDKADRLFQEMDLTGLESGILYDRVYPVADLRNEGYMERTMNATYFSQAYSELALSDYYNRFNDPAVLRSMTKDSDALVEVGLINVDMQFVEKQAVIDGEVFLNANGLIERADNTTSPFGQKAVRIIAPLQKYVNGLSFQLVWNSDFSIQTRGQAVTAVEVNTGSEFLSLAMDGRPLDISFSDAGTHSLTFKLTMNDGEVIQLSSSIKVKEIIDAKEMRSPGQETGILTVNAQIPFQGYDESIAIRGRGQAKVYLDNVDGVFDKPIILIDGFDPGDGRTVEDIYSLLDFGTQGENLADMVRDDGYDVVLLNFPNYTKNGVDIDGGADYVQRNAMVLVEALRRINLRKQGDEELVVIGPSMGGLIARYALRYMEMNAMDHETRLFVSFDSPHLGANIPIGAQYLINYYGNEYGDQATQDLVDEALRSAAAKQMLIDHVDGHLANGSNVEQNPSLKLPAGAPGFRDVFQAELDAMGFPQDCRNVSLANGSVFGNTVESPNALALNTNFDIAFSVSADATLRYTPAAGNTNTVCSLDGYILFFIPVFSFDARSEAFSYTDGLDSAPGGTTDILSTIEAFGEESDLIDPNDVLVEEFSFIPVYSSLAIPGEVNQHLPVNPASVSEFDAYYGPLENEEHVTLTEGNVDFVLDEINIGLPSGLVDGSSLFNLRENQIQQELWFDINDVSDITGQVNVSISNVAGQVIDQQTAHLNGSSISISVNLSPGVYMAVLRTGSYSQIERFVVQ